MHTPSSINYRKQTRIFHVFLHFKKILKEKQAKQTTQPGQLGNINLYVV